MKYDLQRFLDAQKYMYDVAKRELSHGKKYSHYMWFMFPQIRGLGCSEKAQYYGIESLEEAQEYLKHPILRIRLEELIQILLNLDCDDAYQIFDSPDDMKLKSSMTLFKLAEPDNEMFGKVLQKFFQGKEDEYTLKILARQTSKQDLSINPFEI